MSLKGICLIGLLSLFARAGATPVLDIDLTPSVDPWAINGGTRLSLFEQTYTAGLEGRLTGIEFFYVRPYSDISPFGYTVTPESIEFFVGLGAGFVDESELYKFTVFLPVADKVTPFFVDVGAAAINFHEGSTFIVGWRGTGLYDSYPAIHGSYTFIDNGVRDRNMVTGDMGQSAINPSIRTYVEISPVPEPAVIHLLAVGALVLLVKRYRKSVRHR